MKKINNILFTLLILCLIVPVFSGCNAKTTLETPSIIGVEQTQNNLYLTFSTIESAECYDVVINNTTYQATSSPFKITSILTENIIYEISIKAISLNAKINNSSFSEAFYFNNKLNLNSPTISLNGSILSWQAVTNATHYTVCIDNVTFITNSSSINLLTNQNALAIINAGDGTYLIKVKANSNSEYNSSEYSNEIEYNVE